MTPSPNQQPKARQPHWNWLGCGMVLGLFMGGSGFASAQVPDVLTTCLNPSATLEGSVETLVSQGWAVASPPNEETLTAVAWTGVPQYMAGDSGGASLAEILALKTKTAQGLTRKVDLPTSKTRILVRQQDTGQDTLVLVWRTTAITHRIETQCHVALGVKSAATLIGPDAIYENASGFTRITAPDVAGSGLYQDVDIVLLDTEVLSAETGTDMSIAAVIETFSGTAMEGN